MQPTPENAVDIFLQPGDFYFGDRHTRIRTLLGSCVSITMWHPQKLIGGMCHFMLPSRGNKTIKQLDGRYADEAILLFLSEAVRYSSHPAEFVIKVFGGGKMFPGILAHEPCRDRPCAEVMHLCHHVSCRNVVQSTTLLCKAGLPVESHDLGGTSSRNIVFDVWSGEVWVRKNETPASVSSVKRKVHS